VSIAFSHFSFSDSEEIKDPLRGWCAKRGADCENAYSSQLEVDVFFFPCWAKAESHYCFISNELQHRSRSAAWCPSASFEAWILADDSAASPAFSGQGE